MIVAVFKDGTVPIAIAKVVASDHNANLNHSNRPEGPSYGEELAASDAHEYVELFEVPDDTIYLAVTWMDGMGFGVSGFSTLLPALRLIEDNGRQPTEYGPGHWNITYGSGDDESYGHVFRIEDPR